MTRRRLSCALILDPADRLMPTASPLAARRSPLAARRSPLAARPRSPRRADARRREADHALERWKIFRSWAQLLPRIDIPAGR
ncbi:hypothetical protein FJ964_29285 [Mesorhizobium sp. B2-3-2]|nr:hypothetical protein FJ964_29285 [Mesorhizobium sp. B2-3-2]